MEVPTVNEANCVAARITADYLLVPTLSGTTVRELCRESSYQRAHRRLRRDYANGLAAGVELAILRAVYG